MKTTLDLPADLVRLLKRRAKTQRKNLADTAAEAIRIGLAQDASDDTSVVIAKHKKTGLPLIVCRQRPSAKHTLTPDRVAQILSEQELKWARDSA